MRKPRAINPWSVLSGVLVSLHSTIALIDGFNLYHAIASLRRPELKWLNVKALAAIFINTSTEQLDEVFYFTAYADHVAAPVLQAQKTYIKALKIVSVVISNDSDLSPAIGLSLRGAILRPPQIHTFGVAAVYLKVVFTLEFSQKSYIFGLEYDQNRSVLTLEFSHV